MEKIKGLTSDEVAKKKSLGLSNDVVDSYSPSTFIIFQRNIFSLINIVIIPLMIVLFTYELYRDVFAFTTFLVINTVVSILDELRIKRQLEKLKHEFQKTVIVIRDGVEHEIPTNEIVESDVIKAKEGEGVIADGQILYENFLQLDESALNGESNYIRKYKDEKVFSGSYIVTGQCVYKVLSVGKNNYLNQLGAEALKFREKKSPMQKNADKLILFLVVSSISLGLLNFYASGLSGTVIEQRILGLTTIISLIIPQTLIFLFTLTFTISITRLYNKGILVQKGGSIEDLANINVICFDKTGTITTNDMKIINVEYFNVEEDTIGRFYNSVRHNIVGVNKTQEIINKYYAAKETFNFTEFDQIPFTSKNKYSLVSAKNGKNYHTLVFGAFSMLKDNIDPNIIKKIENHVIEQEDTGNRILIGIYYESDKKLVDTTIKDFDLNSAINNVIKESSAKIAVFTIEETLNPGIKQILSDLSAQGIQVKIISGDSYQSVNRVMQRLGLNTQGIVDLSTTKENIEDLVKNKDIFTRAKPEDKLTIVNALRKSGFKVAMVGDGINDVLSLKASDVSIAMEGGSKIAREVSDMVLLNNDYSKIPDVFYEGENIIFNLKTTSKIFLAKSFLAMLLGLFFSLNKTRMPLEPASALIFSFLGSSAPSYVLIFTRQKVVNGLNFFRDLIGSALPVAILYSGFVVGFYLHLKNLGQSFSQINTALVILILSLSIIYSLFLVWEAKKLKNIFVVVFFYALMLLVGIYETLLPLNWNNRSVDDMITLFIPMLFAAVLLFIAVFKILKLKKLWQTVLLAIFCVVALGAVSIFPFQQYYSVTSIPANIHLDIQLVSLLSIPLIFIVNFVAKKLIIGKAQK